MSVKYTPEIGDHVSVFFMKHRKEVPCEFLGRHDKGGYLVRPLDKRRNKYAYVVCGLQITGRLEKQPKEPK